MILVHLALPVICVHLTLCRDTVQCGCMHLLTVLVLCLCGIVCFTPCDDPRAYVAAPHTEIALCVSTR